MRPAFVPEVGVCPIEDLGGRRASALTRQRTDPWLVHACKDSASRPLCAPIAVIRTPAARTSKLPLVQVAGNDSFRPNCVRLKPLIRLSIAYTQSAFWHASSQSNVRIR